MAAGLPYDSDAGRDYAACVTAIMCGQAYLQSSRIAELCPPLVPATEPTQKGLAETNLGSNAMPGGACPGWYINREPFLDVIRMHRASVNNINKTNVPTTLFEASKTCWDEALANGEKHGYRNSQVTVLAPTGTIGFMMDCDTTGVEPDLALVKYKKLVGGGMIKIVNNTVPTALFKLGYSHDEADKIVSYIDATGTIEGAPHIQDAHLAVFDCSFKPAKGTRSISYLGHIKMMAAAQPFISGAISKTVNLPENASVEDIMEAYIQSWKLGVKAVAIYRDGCKKSQPLSAAGTKTAQSSGASVTPVPSVVEADLNAPPRAVRNRLPEERASITHKFKVGDHEGYITVGLYPDGEPGEIFITMAKEGSTVSGLMDSFACAVSIALQHGVPLKLLCEKFAHTRFEPSGWSGNGEIGFAKSIMDYIFRWLQLRFLTGQQQLLFENLRLKPSALSTQPSAIGDLTSSSPTTNDVRPTTGSVHAADNLASLVDLGDAPTCSFCGSIMTRNGSCYRCMSCGSTSGCS
jgi:ribonucleoside-diphosphate reductase alpha chain